MIGSFAVEPVPCEERRRRVGLDAPEGCADRPGRERGEANDLLRCLCLVRTGDKCFAEELQRERPPVGPQLVPAGSFEPDGNSDVRRREATEHALALFEGRVAGAVELQGRDDPLADPDGVDAHRLRPRPRGDVADRGRQTFVRARRGRLELLRVEPVEAQPRALELGGERGRFRADGAGDETSFVRRDCADDDEVASRCGGRGLGEAVERFGERAVLEQPAGGPVEALEQLVFTFVCDPPHDLIMRLCPA